MKKTPTKKPQMNESLDEAQPVGALSRAGNWLKSQLPTFAPGSAATSASNSSSQTGTGFAITPGGFPTGRSTG